MLVALSAQIALAQSASPMPKITVVSVQPIGLVFGLVAVEAEHVVSPATTIGVGATYLPSNDRDKTTFASADIKFRYYLGAHAFQGADLGLQFGFEQVSAETSYPPRRIATSGPTVGAFFDYSWLVGANHSYYVGAGLGAKFLFMQPNPLYRPPDGYPTGRLSFGYAF
ncbi:MAG: hypothetical protein NVS4B3_03420 [Gemmatimonadaceae bacterium]